jgi:DNA-binding transcriptional MerR regulator
MKNQDLLTASDIVDILKISIHSLRDYRKRGLILVAAKRGNTDLYDKAEVMRRWAIIGEKRKDGFSLSQISLMLSKESANLIKMPGPQEPTSSMSEQELLHGFLAELYQKAGPVTKNYIDEISRKWNIRFRKKEK